MRGERSLYPYQQAACRWIMDHPRCGLFLDMGLGKTACTLTAIDRLIYDELSVRKVLVIAPLRVASSVWAQEASTWEHLRHLRVSRVLGSIKQRETALRASADIYVVNRENVAWLTSCARWDWDMVVLDELSSFKNPSAVRFKCLRRVIGRAKRVVGLTGTPAPNGLMDLWAEVYLLDGGERLGRTITRYRQTYFTPGWSNGVVVYEYIPRPGADQAIRGRLSDICLSMTKEQYLDMPPIVYRTVDVELPAAARTAYRELERTSLADLPDGRITASTAAVVNTKLQQLTGGAVYDEDKQSHVVHAAKLDALQELIEEANGQSVLVFYAYTHERDRILERLGSVCHVIDTEEDIEAWNAGKYAVALAHPASVGHGLNLQQGGHIAIWYGLTWSLELYQQANDRLYRQGQKHTVTVFHIIAQNTVDEACLAALQRKRSGQSALMHYLEQRHRQLCGAQAEKEPERRTA